MKKILSSLLSMLFGLSAHAAGLTNLTPDELQAMQLSGALVVDVRTPEEWAKTGLIPGSKGLTYFDATGGYDKDGWLKQFKPLQSSPSQPVILVCRSGNRSATVGKMLLNEAGFSQVYHLEKGIREWSAQGKALEPKKM